MMSEKAISTIMTTLAERINDLKLEIKVKEYRIVQLERRGRELGANPDDRD